MKKLDGKVAIITGAGRLRGIGYSSAIALAKLGANAKLRAQQEFSWENITSQYIKIINNLNENKKI